MINLLPDDQKQAIRAARTNVVLLRYNMLALVALGFLVVMCGFFYLVLQNTRSGALATSSSNNSKAGQYADVRVAADKYKQNLTIAKQILDNSFNYTPIIFKITQLLPDGVILDGLDLNTTSFGQQTKFTAHAKSYTQATQLKANFQSSDMFTNVYFETLTNENDPHQPKPYPIAISISARINQASFAEGLSKAGN